jgi:hypothetical protein
MVVGTAINGVVGDGRLGWRWNRRALSAGGPHLDVLRHGVIAALAACVPLWEFVSVIRRSHL